MAQKKTPAVKKKIGMQNYEMPDREISSLVVRFNMACAKLGKEKPKSPQELASRFEDFFSLCDKFGLCPTIEGLALVSGYPIKSMWDIENARFHPDFTEIVKDAKQIVQTYDAIMARNGLIPTGVYTFRAKNYYQMKDVQEVTLAPKTDLTPENAGEILKEIPDEL